MAGNPNESEDPLLELRESLDDEPLFGGSKPATPARGVANANGNGKQATGNFPAAKPSVPSAPPPLPPRKSGVSQTQPPVSAKTGMYGAAQPQPPQQPQQGQRTGMFPAARPISTPGTAIPLPAQVVRPQGNDPFQEGPEPRLPSGGDPEEKLKVFRAMVRQKDEALSRGRSLYKAVDEEAVALRAMATSLAQQVELAKNELSRAAGFPEQINSLKEMLEKDTIRADEAEQRIQQLSAELAEADNERKDLTRALAELESQGVETKARLDDERKTREALADELIGAKEALSLAQDRVTELGAKASELQGELEAVTEQHTANSQELERAQLELENAKQELASHESQQEEAVALNARLNAEVEAYKAKSTDLEEKFAVASTKLQTLESEQEWSKNSIDQAQSRVTELEQMKQMLEQEKAQLGEAHVESQKAADEAQAEVADLKSLLAEKEGEAQARIESLEEQVREAQQLGRTQVGNVSKELQAAQAELNKLRERVGQHETELNKARQEVETAALRKLRGELNDANSRAMEAGGSGRREREAREAAENRIRDLEARARQAEQAKVEADQRAHAAELKAKELEGKAAAASKGAGAGDARAKALEQKVAALETEVKTQQTAKTLMEKELHSLRNAPKPAAAAGGSASSASNEEVEKLKADLAKLKQRAAAAENAMEAAASLKAKVARLEAQLKAGPAKK